MIKQKIQNTNDLSKVSEITRNLIGLPCWNAYIGYGFELVLHFGEKESYDHPLFSGKFRGSHRLRNRGNNFDLFFNGKMVDLDEKEEQDVENQINKIINTTVVDIDINYPELNLTINFSNGSSLILYADDDDLNLAYWELFTPDQMVLEFGPHQTWCYKKLDENLKNDRV